MRHWSAAVFSVGSCLAARLSRRVNGVPWALLVSSWSYGCSLAGQLGASACRRAYAAVVSPAQGKFAARRSRRRRPPRTIRPAQVKSRSRTRFGSQRRAVPGKASICIQASSSHASATISHQIWLCEKPCSGRLRSPVSFAQRTGPRTGRGAGAEVPGPRAGRPWCPWRSR